MEVTKRGAFMGIQYHAPEVAEGDFLGDYQVLGVLGRGLLGTCYHVYSNALRKEFVLKTLKLSMGVDLDWLARVEAQAALLGRLAHPCVDSVLQSGQSGSMWYLVKDFVHDGEGSPCDLETYLTRHQGHLSSYQLYHLMEQLLSALSYAAHFQDAHHNGLFHGNLKPSNILMGHSRSPGRGGSGAAFEMKLTDFQPYGLVGSAEMLESFAAWKGFLGTFPQRVGLQAEDQAMESLFRDYDYRPPEWQPGRPPSLAGDIFALGAIFYELIAGQVPSGRYPAAGEIRPDLGDEWDKILGRCLAFYPDLRYSSYEELRADLEGVAPELEPATLAPPSRAHVWGRDGLTPQGMLYIPAGSFFVGSQDCGRDAQPVHEASTPGFYCDRSLVTNAQFAQFIEETGYVTEAEQGEGAPVWVSGEWKVLPGIHWRQPTGQPLPPDFAHHPVTQVSYADVLAYCEWIGRRLPTEEEWEYAARGGLADVRYPHGNTLNRYQANFNSEGTTPVGSYPANGYGLLDMAGNVWEWTSSWYQAYPGGAQDNPHFGKQYRVVRGGSWLYDGSHCQIAYRNANQPDRAYPTLGFRTVCEFGRGGSTLGAESDGADGNDGAQERHSHSKDA